MWTFHMWSIRGWIFSGQGTLLSWLLFLPTPPRRTNWLQGVMSQTFISICLQGIELESSFYIIFATFNFFPVILCKAAYIFSWGHLRNSVRTCRKANVIPEITLHLKFIFDSVETQIIILYNKTHISSVSTHWLKTLPSRSFKYFHIDVTENSQGNYLHAKYT